MQPVRPDRRSAFADRLVAWYERHRRELPWRATSDPYRIWVAEIMLQQTRVATAQSYYERFIEAFPTVHDLASAPQEDVLKLWEGLGYYSRARNLHRAARIVVDRHDGQLPRTREELLALPGIGPYTVGAILSIAFGEPEPALDGNVRRVMSRVMLIEDDPHRSPVERQILAELRALIPPEQPAAFNQALMELGSTVCVTPEPRCLICPVSDLCSARAVGRQAELPIRPSRRARPHHDVAVGLIRHGAHLLLIQRPPEGLLGGLWELPGGKREDGETLAECLAREVAEELGINVRVGEHRTTVEHGYSHFRVTLHAFDCAWTAGEPSARGCHDWAWARDDELAAYPLPRGTHKILDALESD